MNTTPNNLDRAADLFAEAYRISREYEEVLAEAFKESAYYFGERVTSSGLTDFTESVMCKLRPLARDYTAAINAAHAARPPRVRRSTMLKLEAFIIARDGGGFYGHE